jgi:hypothetical protein
MQMHCSHCSPQGTQGSTIQNSKTRQMRRDENANCGCTRAARYNSQARFSASASASSPASLRCGELVCVIAGRSSAKSEPLSLGSKLFASKDKSTVHVRAQARETVITREGTRQSSTFRCAALMRGVRCDGILLDYNQSFLETRLQKYATLNYQIRVHPVGVYTSADRVSALERRHVSALTRIRLPS